MKSLSEADKALIYTAFHKNINLTSDELRAWLETDESQSVGIVIGTSHQKKKLLSSRESIGHASGRRIVLLLEMSAAKLDDDDYRHMRKVNGYINRHTAQVPEKSDIRTSRWRYSLMNWGHDPLAAR